jgi:hypothetical protein
MFLKNKIYLFVVGIFCLNALLAQVSTIEILEQGRKTSIRGMSVVNNNVIWVSGSGGSVGKSLDGGKTWNWITVSGYEKSDFRDIEAFDDKTALIMGITQPAVILKTKDGGLSWRKVFEDTAKAAFFDAMAFEVEGKDTVGALIGDPIKKIQYVAAAFTENEKMEWSVAQAVYDTSLSELEEQCAVIKGEAFFASSGTNLCFIKPQMIPLLGFVVSGGTKTSLIHYPIGYKYDIPMLCGKTSTGANSIAILKEKNKGVIVGGDFANDTLRDGNMVLFSYDENNLKPTFLKSTTPPHGYRSCVIYIDENNLITCGTSGVDISKDGGMNWELISKESFHVVQKAKDGNAVFLAGKGGRIAKLVINNPAP